MSDIEPVAWAIFRDGELDWEHDLPFSDEPQSMMDDEESRPLYGGEVIEQLRADAERYRWLRDHGVTYVICRYEKGEDVEDGWCGWLPLDARESWCGWLPLDTRETDAAIDAAMKEEK